MERRRSCDKLCSEGADMADTAYQIYVFFYAMGWYCHHRLSWRVKGNGRECKEDGKAPANHEPPAARSSIGTHCFGLTTGAFDVLRGMVIHP
jgi:hypothetical protein